MLRDYNDLPARLDAVNLASRLEGPNKFTGTSNLLTQATADKLKDRFLLRPIGKLQVVGKESAVMTYEAIAPLDQASDEQREMVSLTGKMVEAFVQSRFAECIQFADELEQRFGPDSSRAFTAPFPPSTNPRRPRKALKAGSCSPKSKLPPPLPP